MDHGVCKPVKNLVDFLKGFYQCIGSIKGNENSSFMQIFKFLLSLMKNNWKKSYSRLAPSQFDRKFFLSLTCPRNKLWEREVKSLSAI